MKELPLVSIVMITYNHENYIRDAIKGVMDQETDFLWELIIGEDHSADSTRQICNEYAMTSDGRIIITETDHNLGALMNFVNCLGQCKGKYVAFCEGDDYWSDPHKLAKQVKYLSSNPDIALIHTNKQVLYNGVLHSADPLVKTTGYLFEELLLSNFICMPTVMAETEILKIAVDRAVAGAGGLISRTPDYSFWLELALENKIGYLDEVTAVYRYLDESMIHTRDQVKMLAYERSLMALKKYYFKKYVSENSQLNHKFKYRFGESIFHTRKRLILDHGVRASGEIIKLIFTNPFITGNIIAGKLKKQRLFKS
jgi:glycosyltransferase involved in cell wall biosynthesis